MAKNLQRRHYKNTFFEIDGETIGSQGIEKSFQMAKVCLPIRRTHMGVVHVCKHTFQTVRGAVHHSLKSLCCVRKPKWSEHILKEAKWRDNHRFWDVCDCNRDLVITLEKVNFFLNDATMRAIGKVLHASLMVKGSQQIEMAINPTRSPGSIFFANHVCKGEAVVILNGEQCWQIPNV